MMRLLLLLRRLPVVLIGLVGHDQRTCPYVARLWSIPSAIKSWMGSTHFQMKTLKHVSTEMALHVLAYNMKRVTRILGVGGLTEAILT